MTKTKKIDRLLLTLVILLSLVGIFVFTSASFGLFVRKGFSLQDIFFDQIALGLFLGIISLIFVLKIPLTFWRTYALHIFVASVVLTTLVFVPYVGFEHGGAKRWISIGSVSFQPSEILKLGTVIYFAALLASFKKDRLKKLSSLLAVTGGTIALPAIVLLLEPDTGTLAVLFFALCAMLIAGGAKLRHLFLLFICALLAIGLLALTRPYVKERILTFFDPARDPHGSSYQIQRSLIAIGSGGVTGRGFGQSVQKVSSLPEPTGDSIFAVIAEEFGLLGGVFVIALFLLFALRGFQIAQRAPDIFSGLLAVGIVILIVSQSFANIAAMLGVIPLTGLPLVFMSHGGSALLFAFIEIGILFNISKSRRI